MFAPARAESRADGRSDDGGHSAEPYTESAVKVFARFRPPVTAEEREDCPALHVHPENRHVFSADNRFRFELDHVFDETASQEQLYKHVGVPVVEDVLNGYNGTIFTYGNTGSGKTFCLFGPNSPGPEFNGLAPRAVQQILDFVASNRAKVDGAEYVIHCSFMEIYRERMRDLLDPGNTNLKLKDVPLRGPVVDGLTHQAVSSVADVFRVLQLGNSSRATAPTRLNDHSSRSHAVFSMHVERRVAGGLQRIAGKLALVDLAGSERVSRSKSTGETLEEAKSINMSLTALGKVIDALAERRAHVPYRDSLLTRVLEEALGGNCRTTMLVTASTCTQHYDETLSSLRFATRAREVQNCSTVNYMYSPEQLLGLVGRLQKELLSARRYIGRLEGLDHRGLGHCEARTPASNSDEVMSSTTEEPGCSTRAGFQAWSSTDTPGSTNWGTSPSGSTKKLLFEDVPDCLDQGTAAVGDDAALVASATAALRTLEEALVAQEASLEEARALAGDLGGVAAAGGGHSAGSGVGSLVVRWKALWSEADAQSLRWRLALQQHRAEGLSRELEMRSQRVRDLQHCLEASKAQLVREMQQRRTLASASSPPRRGSQGKSCEPEGVDPLLPRLLAASQNQASTEQLTSPEDESELSKLRAELAQREQQVTALAAELVVRDVRVEALRHEVGVKDAMLAQLQAEAWSKVERRDEDLHRLVEDVAQHMAALMQRDPSVDAAKGAPSPGAAVSPAICRQAPAPQSPLWAPR